MAFLVIALHDDPLGKNQLPNRFIVDIVWSILKTPFLHTQSSLTYDRGLQHLHRLGKGEVTCDEEPEQSARRCILEVSVDALTDALVLWHSLFNELIYYLLELSIDLSSLRNMLLLLFENR